MIWNQHLSQIPWNAIWKNAFFSYTWPENNNTLYILLHYATRTNDHIFRWTNQKHLKTPTCKYCKNIENIKHLFVECKQNRKIWTHFQKYYQKLTHKDYTPLQHILSISAILIPSNTKKLILTLTVTILIHTWKTRNRHSVWRYNNTDYKYDYQYKKRSENYYSDTLPTTPTKQYIRQIQNKILHQQFILSTDWWFTKIITMTIVYRKIYDCNHA